MKSTAKSTSWESKLSSKPSKPLLASARSSPLSRAQVEEVKLHLPLETTFLTTPGDRDHTTSLRTLNKTDFFTKDIDDHVRIGFSRIGIHSAKDLPDHIPEGLTIAAITKGVDNRDSLVLNKPLKPGLIIATSSEKREAAVRLLQGGLTFVDIRGTIHERLAKLETGEIDGLVIAEAALIRLKLTHLNRIILPGKTTPGQGQLALITREDDLEMRAYLSCIDSRKKTLYVGLNCPKDDLFRTYTHCPLIKIAPTGRLPDITPYTHFIFTSQTAVSICQPPPNKMIISVGRKTTEKLQSYGIPVNFTAENECAEGIIELLKTLDLRDARFFWPHSALSRRIIPDYLGEKLTECILYETHFNEPPHLPSLSAFDEIFFTSPSTVDAFLHFYKELPAGKILTGIGKITTQALESLQE